MRASSYAAVLLIPVASSLAAQHSTSSTAVATVAQLYRDFAWEVVVEEPEWPGHALLDQPRAILLHYFDPHLTDLLLAERACTNQSREHGRLEFMPMWGSQDPAATELKVLPTQDSSVVVVTFRYPSNGGSIALTYHLQRNANGWRIRDIAQGSRWSLLALLSAKC